VLVGLSGCAHRGKRSRSDVQLGTDEEQAYLGEVLESLELLLGWEGQTVGEVDEVVEAISTAFSKAWDSQAKEP
jgi:hypothetical protein